MPAFTRRQDEAGCPGQLALVPGPMETPLLDWLLVKKWGLAPAIACKTKEISLLGRCLSPVFHNERTQELVLAAVPRRAGIRPAGRVRALACFLASAASSYITGAGLPLDGGGGTA